MCSKFVQSPVEFEQTSSYSNRVQAQVKFGSIARSVSSLIILLNIMRKKESNYKSLNEWEDNLKRKAGRRWGADKRKKKCDNRIT